MSARLTAAETAAFDQVHATYGEIIDALVARHRAAVTEDGNRELRTAGLASFLNTDITRRTVAEMLAVCIDRLALGATDHV